jgi:hypothetical protein
MKNIVCVNNTRGAPSQNQKKVHGAKEKKSAGCSPFELSLNCVGVFVARTMIKGWAVADWATWPK